MFFAILVDFIGIYEFDNTQYNFLTIIMSCKPKNRIVLHPRRSRQQQFLNIEKVIIKS